jgi:hypothetical protein
LSCWARTHFVFVQLGSSDWTGELLFLSAKQVTRRCLQHQNLLIHVLLTN